MKATIRSLPVAGVLALALWIVSVGAQVAPPPPANLLTPLPGAPAPAPSPSPSPAPVVVLPPNPPPAAPGPLPGNVLAWDTELKDIKAKVGDPAAEFSFNFTNVSSSDVTITLVQPSCGCTAVKLPPMPWKIVPGTNGTIPGRMNLTGVPGAFFKNITVHTDKGLKMLSIKVVVDPAPPVAMTEDERKRNQELVKQDPQAIFKGDCARCHVAPVIGKIGKELYDTACGICHEAEHRASIVPSLHALNHDTNAEFWRSMVADGKPGSLMPAFSQAKGGPLSDPQIATLVDYLVKTMPAKAVATNAIPSHAAK